MKFTLLSAAALAAAALTVTLPAAPASAQRSSYDIGGYWSVLEITVEDGQFENYMDFINTDWKKSAEFQKSKGYIKDYHILWNQDKRKGEPDLYFVTLQDKLPTPAEEMKMQDEFVAFMKKDEHKMDAESAVRVKMRTVDGNQLLRELILKK